MQKAFLDDAMTKCLKQSKLNHLSVFNFKCNAMCDFFLWCKIVLGENVHNLLSII